LKVKKENTHVVVLGAGLAGLSAAANLSKKGIKVTVLEKIHQAGGYVHSFKRGKYRFEASTHQICGVHKKYLDPLFDQLDLKRDLLVRSKSLFECLKFNAKTHKIESRVYLKSGYKEIYNTLLGLYPNDKKDIDKYFKLLSGIGNELYILKSVVRDPKKNIHHAIPALFLKSNVRFLKKLGMRYYKHLIKLSKITQKEIMENIKNEELRWILNSYSIYSACSVSEVSGLVMSAINFMYFDSGPYSIKGGSANLINSLIQTIEKNGGEIKLNSPVAKINIASNKAHSVETTTGDTYVCDYVLSGMNAQDLMMNYIDKIHLPKEYLEKIQNTKYSISVFQVYLGLQIDIRDYGFPSCTTFIDSTIDHQESHEYSYSLDIADRHKTSSVITNYSNYDSTAAPEGHSVVCIAEMMPLNDWEDLDAEAYKKRKKEMEDAIISKVEKVTGIPLKDNIVVKFSGTPRTMRKYSSTPQGAMTGAKVTIDQSINKRLQIETPIKNIFLAGSSIGMPGVAGSLESGMVASNTLLKSMS